MTTPAPTDPATVRVRQPVAGSRQVVYSLLADPHTYPEWLVGAKGIVEVDDGWPDTDTHFRHRVGIAGPLTIEDTTRSLGAEPPRRLDLEVRFRPVGRGHVTFHVEAGSDDAGGDGTSVVVFDEAPLGALRMLAPVLAPLTRARNTKSMRSFADLVTSRAGRGGATQG